MAVISLRPIFFTVISSAMEALSSSHQRGFMSGCFCDKTMTALALCSFSLQRALTHPSKVAEISSQVSLGSERKVKLLHTCSPRSWFYRGPQDPPSARLDEAAVLFILSWALSFAKTPSLYC
jgi:hypothetical protein